MNLRKLEAENREQMNKIFIKEKLENVITVLNEINKLDPTVLLALISYRVPCNQALADHPTVQVGKSELGDYFEVGLLGILNGLFGVKEDGYGYIAAEFDGDTLKGFKLLT